MKIALLIDQLLAGGVQLSAIEQIKELTRQGHQAELLILMRKSYPTDYSYLVQGISHRYLSDSYPAPFRHTHKFPVFSFLSTLHLLSPIMAPRVIGSRQYDVILGLGTTTCLTALAISKWCHIPYLAVIHDPIVYILDKCYSHTPLKYFFFVFKPLARFFEALFVKHAMHTIVISALHQKYLHNTYGISPVLLGFGVHPQKHLPIKRGRNLLSFGRWEKGKNPLMLLDIIQKLPKQHLIIAGTWTSQADLAWFRSEIKSRGLTSQVTLVTHYSDSGPGLTKLCNQSLVWLHPNFEAFGLAALEATSHGLPIIIPRGSGVTASFTHGSDGFFPSHISALSYLRYINKLIAIPALAHSLGKHAWSTTIKRHSWSAITHQLLRLIGPIPKPTITILETCHATGHTLAGGDKLMEPMLANLKNTYSFRVIVTHLGRTHWDHNPIPKHMTVLRSNPFDTAVRPIPLFFSYIVRMLQTCWHLLTQPAPTIIYSSTNVLPDVLPAYVLKLIRPRTIWVARIHHLIPSPSRREGKWYVNVGSYLMQSLAITLTKHSTITIALNSQLREQLVDKGFNPSSLRVLGAGINQAQIARHPKPVKPKYAGVFVGRLHSSKGVFDLEPIWSQVVAKLPQAKLAVLGPGREYLHPKPTLPSIHLLGHVSDTRKFTLLKSSRVFLFTDHEAGWGIAVAEAMAASLPVIGYDIGILGNVYTSGYLTVPPYDIAYFAKQIIRLLTNPQLISHYSQLAYHESLNLDWSITAQKFKMILDETLVPPLNQS